MVFAIPSDVYGPPSPSLGGGPNLDGSPNLDGGPNLDDGPIGVSHVWKQNNYV
jgi:hypothetical protein